MSSLFGIGANGASSFYNGVATQSLRFNDDDTAYLSRTPSSASNQKTWTYSTWFKIANTNTFHTILSAGATGTPRIALYLSSGGQLITDVAAIGSYDESVARFRDASAWYHLVWAFDTTQATGSNRSRMYINGTEITLTKTRTWSLDTNYAVNGNVLHTIGTFSNSIGSFNSDKYQAETNFVDGSQLNPTSFGETKNGVWIAKRYTGSYGTNGFRLQFNQTGTGSASSSTIGADTSGNANHFSSSGIVASDCDMPDCPENNFCTWNPLSNTGVTLSNGNLETSGGALAVCGGTMAVTSGKWYWECKLKSTVNAYNPVNLAFVSATTIAHAENYEQGVYYYTDNGINKAIKHIENNSVTQSISIPSAFDPIAVDDVMQYAYDGDTGKIWFGINNVWADNSGGTTGNPSTGANPTFTLADTSIFMTPLRDHAGVVWTGHANFGQLDYDYTAPTDFNPLSTANLPEPTISPNAGTQADDYFNTVLYTGNASTNAITGVGFQPDFLWVKRRNLAAHHNLIDSVRGVKKHLSSSATNAEDTEGSGNGLASFDADGFTWAGVNTGTGQVNANGGTFVAWNWKVNGGTTSSNTNGSITSSVSANQDAGFSIVSYTGTGSGATVGHGVGKELDFIIIKRRSDSSTWAVYSRELGSGKKLELNGTSGTITNAQFFTSNPTSSVFSLGTEYDVNGSGGTFVAYCFAEIEGYSKFGSYTGNNSDDGPFVYLGFRPAFVIIKESSASGNAWVMYDNKRELVNPIDLTLQPHLNSAEIDDPDQLDFVSNGFKMRANSTNARMNNASAATYIYMAFAESPFKYANAR